MQFEQRRIYNLPHSTLNSRGDLGKTCPTYTQCKIISILPFLSHLQNAFPTQFSPLLTKYLKPIAKVSLKILQAEKCLVLQDILAENIRNTAWTWPVFKANLFLTAELKSKELDGKSESFSWSSECHTMGPSALSCCIFTKWQSHV